MKTNWQGKERDQQHRERGSGQVVKRQGEIENTSRVEGGRRKRLEVELISGREKEKGIR